MLNTLDPSVPPNPEPAGLGAGQIRDFKLAVRSQFPDVSGDAWDIPLTVGPRTINAVGDKVEQDDFNELEARMSVAELALVNQAIAITALDARLDTVEGAGYTTLAAAVAASINAAWPVGATFISYDGGTPTSKGLPGTWASYGTGAVLMGAAGTFGSPGGSMSLTIGLANMPSHDHFVANPDSGAATLISSNIMAQRDSGSYNLKGTANLATIGKSSLSGSGTALDITPAHIKVAFYRRTA